jgi:hypothetical protein
MIGAVTLVGAVKPQRAGVRYGSGAHQSLTHSMMTKNGLSSK